MASNEFTCDTRDGPPQDQNSTRRRSTSSLNSAFLDAADELTNATGESSLNLSGLRSLDYVGSDEEHSTGELFDDEKARIMAHLMQNHALTVTATLVERTMLIQSIIWLSRHVPLCVLDLLFETVQRNRTKSREHTELSQSSTNEALERTRDTEILRDMKQLSMDAGDSGEYDSRSLDDTEDRKQTDSFMPSLQETLPISKNSDSALLFVDMSGFTKISTVLDVESLSNTINSYFQLIVNEVTHHGGDILKFAGDAIFAEWKASSSEPVQNIEYCVLQAAKCAASIVANCSDYPVHSKPVGQSRASIRLENTRQSFRSLIQSSGHDSNRNLRGSIQSAIEYDRKESITADGYHDVNLHRRGSTGQTHRISIGNAPRPVKLATLNVKCGIGKGRVVGVHVGDDSSRREYLILGDPIDQVTAAERMASSGEVFASPEAFEVLSRAATLTQKFDEAENPQQPVCIAKKQQQFFEVQEQLFTRECPLNDTENILQRCEVLEDTELRWLQNAISLYVHPVVVSDEIESHSKASLRRASDFDRHLSQAELRNVFVMFVSPLIDCKLSGDEEKDLKLIKLLNDIMNLTTKHLRRVGGQLRQFIVDDKGVVLICTFGLRGSTFPNMISQRALPLTRSMSESLQEELGVSSHIGATFGRAYCGIVGAADRHEFAVLGPSVNLAARLMASKFNPGILVDKNIRLLSSHSQIFFKPLHPVNAKGYDEPVPIFEPIKSNNTPFGGKLKPNFIGRANEIKQVMQIAQRMVANNHESKLVLLDAASGLGKSSTIAQTTARIRAMMKRMKKNIIVTRHVSNEGDSRLPFSLFRSVFKNLLNEMRHDDDTGSHSSNRGELSAIFSVDDMWDNLSLVSQSTKDSVMSTDANRFAYICEELNAPPEFVEVVGRKLLGIRDKGINSSVGGTSNLDGIVEFLAEAFIMCTNHADFVLLTLDDVQDLDEMSFRVVQTIFFRASNALILCGSRPPSDYPLSIESSFWEGLHDTYLKEGRFVEITLQPLTECEVQDCLAANLDVNSEEISGGFSHNIYTVTGGMPHFLSYVIDAIKRQKLFTRLDNGLIGLKSAASREEKVDFGSVSELLLYRIDSLDSSVRNVLQLAACLGTEFELVDACLVYDEMHNVLDSERAKAAFVLQESFLIAVDEGIIEESFALSSNEEEEEVEEPEIAQTSLCASLGNITLNLKGYRKSHPAYQENRRYRFTHDSWKTSILNVILDERRQEIHEHIAIILERDIGAEDQDDSDIEKQIRILRHWNASGHFINSSEIALKIGSQLMTLGLNSQGILIFDDVIDTLRDFSEDHSEKTYGGISKSVLNAIEASELENLIKLFISKGKAHSTLGNPENGADALQSALDILQNARSADSSYFDRSVSFPIFSGLFVVLKMGAIQDDESCSYEKDLTNKFVEQARLNKDPVHYGRALAMQGETFGRLGLFDQALESLDNIKAIYDIQNQHDAICKVYGSDRVGQAFSHSVNWNIMLGRTDEALETCRYILNELAPKSDPRNVHNSFCLLYSTFIALKENGAALEARDAVKRFVVEPFNEHFGPGGSTFSKPLFYPLLMLLDLEGHQDDPIEMIDEYLEWASNESILSVCTASLENAWAAFAVAPNTWLGEICYYLAERPERQCSKLKEFLIKQGIELIEKSIEATQKLPYAYMYAKKKRAKLNL